VSETRAFVTWRDLGVKDRSRVSEVIEYASDPLMGHRVLCVGPSGCPLWFDVDRLELDPS
jgi:hypothetical protein